MTYQDKYNNVISRMMLPENRDRRNPQFFSETDTIIANCVADMKSFITRCKCEDNEVSAFDKIRFEDNYNKVISLLDQLGWE